MPLLRGVRHLDPKIHTKARWMIKHGAMAWWHRWLNNWKDEDRTRGLRSPHGRKWRGRCVISGRVGQRSALGETEPAARRSPASFFRSTQYTIFATPESRIRSGQVLPRRRPRKNSWRVRVRVCDIQVIRVMYRVMFKVSTSAHGAKLEVQ